jgi:hypothetical protein
LLRLYDSKRRFALTLSYRQKQIDKWFKDPEEVKTTALPLFLEAYNNLVIAYELQ